jgi:hypothetical protein
MQSFGCIASDMQFSSQQNSFAASAKLVVQVCERRSCSDSRFCAGFFLPVANLQSDKSFSSVILRKQRRTLTALSSFGTLLQLPDRLSRCQPRIASSSFLARAQQEGQIVETEPEVETGGKLEKGAAAAVTAGIVAQDGSAAIQAAIAAADSAVGIICSFSAVDSSGIGCSLYIIYNCCSCTLSSSNVGTWFFLVAMCPTHLAYCCCTLRSTMTDALPSSSKP